VVSDRDRSGSVQRSGHRGHDRVFPLEFATFARLVDARHARLHDYLARMQAQPAYRRAVTGVAPTPSMPRARMTGAVPATKPLTHCLFAARHGFTVLIPLKRSCGSRNGWPK